MDFGHLLEQLAGNFAPHAKGAAKSSARSRASSAQAHAAIGPMAAMAGLPHENNGPALEPIQYPRSNPDTGYYDAGPQPAGVRYPRYNPDTGYYQAGPNQMPQIRTQQQIQAAPFRMYEDGSFQGNPQQFQRNNPGYRFYEDNTFSPSQAQRLQGASPQSMDLRRLLGL